MNIIIREEKQSEYFETEAMTRRAFYNIYAPGCEEHFLVHKLRGHEDYLPELSRVAIVDGHVAGAIFYSKAVIHTDKEDVTVVTFGPLCVDHRYKNLGIGGKLLEETIPLVKKAGFPGIVIFGEPYYYPKHGFKRAKEYGLTDMEGNTSDPFMALELIEGGLHIMGGRFEESPVFSNIKEEELNEFDQQFETIVKISRPCQWGYENAYDDREGYHYTYASHRIKTFEDLFIEYCENNGKIIRNEDDLIRDIWESIDKTPYVISKGEQPIGILVLSAKNRPSVEHIYIKNDIEDNIRIKNEVELRFYNQNGLLEMKSDNYKEYFTKEYMMAPNSLRLLNELSANTPDAITGNVFDLGCGAALSSIFLAKETNADKVYATDLWISASDNWKRIIANQLEDKIIPIHADAFELPYADGFFDAIVSINSYHYFGCNGDFFADKMLPLLKKGGHALFCVPGVIEEPSGELKELMTEWAQEEAKLFCTKEWWKDNIAKSCKDKVEVKIYESSLFELVWKEWTSSGHEYGIRDEDFLKRGLDKILNYIMIVVKKK